VSPVEAKASPAIPARVAKTTRRHGMGMPSLFTVLGGVRALAQRHLEGRHCGDPRHLV
jgi:hypothetical protein